MIASTLRRLLLLPIVVGLALVVPATTAAADSGHIPVILVDQTLTGLCSFPVFVHILHNTEFETVTTEPDGTTVTNIRGAVISTATNVNTGKTLTLTTSGPGTVTVFPDGSTAADLRGPNASFWGPQAQSAFGLAPIEITWGHLQYTLDPGGNLTSYSLSGRAEDLCAALSSG